MITSPSIISIVLISAIVVNVRTGDDFVGVDGDIESDSGSFKTVTDPVGSIVAATDMDEADVDEVSLFSVGFSAGSNLIQLVRFDGDPSLTGGDESDVNIEVISVNPSKLILADVRGLLLPLSRVVMVLRLTSSTFILERSKCKKTVLDDECRWFFIANSVVCVNDLNYDLAILFFFFYYSSMVATSEILNCMPIYHRL